MTKRYDSIETHNDTEYLNLRGTRRVSEWFKPGVDIAMIVAVLGQPKEVTVNPLNPEPIYAEWDFELQMTTDTGTDDEDDDLHPGSLRLMSEPSAKDLVFWLWGKRFDLGDDLKAYIDQCVGELAASSKSAA